MIVVSRLAYAPQYAPADRLPGIASTAPTTTPTLRDLIVSTSTEPQTPQQEQQERQQLLKLVSPTPAASSQTGQSHDNLLKLLK